MNIEGWTMVKARPDSITASSMRSLAAWWSIFESWGWKADE